MLFACIESVRDVAELGFASSAVVSDELPSAEGVSVLRVHQPDISDIVLTGPGVGDIFRVCSEFCLDQDLAVH